MIGLPYGVSNEFSFCRVAERGDADIGENSFNLGELNPDMAGDADLDGCEGPEGRRVGGTGGLADDCGPPGCECSCTMLILLPGIVRSPWI